MKICPRCNGRNIKLFRTVESNVVKKDILTSIAKTNIEYYYRCLDCGHWGNHATNANDALIAWDATPLRTWEV